LRDHHLIEGLALSDRINAQSKNHADMNYSKSFRVKPGTTVNLGRVDPNFCDKHESESSAKAENAEHQEKLRDLQYLMYAEDKRALLICLQAMDAGGKDGTIRHVMGAMNPQACQVHSFKPPSPAEASHDFLWRVHKAVGGRGLVTVLNRSHYEDVLVVRVHDLVPKKVWSKRYDHINAFEKELTDNGTHILKFFLHISKDEQLRRFKQRLDDPAKQWKISESDYREREFWSDYMTAYERALEECSTIHAPWFVIPSNHKWFRNLAVSQIIVEHLEALKMKFPEPSVDLKQIERKYHRAEKSR
jgi:PPK2 family polyphosphate:nucleotide phosphotransferase